MNKLAIFLVVVFGAAFGVLLLSMQQSQTKNNTNPLTNFPSLTPTQNFQQNQNQNPTATPTVNADQSVQGPVASTAAVILKTSKGNISLTLDVLSAPGTTANFLKKAKAGFYNGLTFHRVEDWVIQGGDPLGNGTGGGQMPTELNQKPFVVGSLGVARGGDIKVSNDSQFFITKQDASWLNGQYTNFGIVTSGMDVVNKISVGDKILGITVE